MPIQRIRTIDSHTGGEPTRLVLDGMPDLGTGPMTDRAKIFRQQFDSFRSTVINEPRGSDILVGALWQKPVNPAATCGVIFFNNVGVLGMCGHGTIGLLATLAYLGQIQPGCHRIETPVGDITTTLHPDRRISVQNVPSFRQAEAVAVEVPGYGTVRGDVAWGGNWFFLVNDHQETLELENVERLTQVTWQIRQALKDYPVDGEIDHIELFGPAKDPNNHSRNFVLCPGKAYDRSPCGTGTSAKLACLAASGKLAPGQIWRQESITGSVFEAQYDWDNEGRVLPTITGTAFVTGENTLIIEPGDSLTSCG